MFRNSLCQHFEWDDDSTQHKLICSSLYNCSLQIKKNYFKYKCKNVNWCQITCSKEHKTEISFFFLQSHVSLKIQHLVKINNHSVKMICTWVIFCGQQPLLILPRGTAKCKLM